jgi:YceI-like domain
VTTTMPVMQLQPGGQPRLAAGSWRVDPAQSDASFTASVVGRPVRGRLPLTGGVLITEPIEDSTARLAARAGAVSTGSPVLDRLLAGPGFLDAGAYPAAPAGCAAASPRKRGSVPTPPTAAPSLGHGGYGMQALLVIAVAAAAGRRVHAGRDLFAAFPRSGSRGR